MTGSAQLTAPIKTPLNRPPTLPISWASERTFTQSGDTTPLTTVSERCLEGRSLAILGGGPNLTGPIGQALAYNRAIAVNNSYLFFHKPCIVVALDRRWWAWHGNQMRSLGHVGVVALLPKQVPPVGFTGLSFRKERDSTYNPNGGVLCGQNSGHAAITLAMHMGASRIYLAGFDMGFVGSQTHWHGGHAVPASSANYERRFRPALEQLVRDAKALDCHITSVTPTHADIPMTSIHDAIEDLR